jgi:hypothetical protein
MSAMHDVAGSTYLDAESRTLQFWEPMPDVPNVGHLAMAMETELLRTDAGLHAQEGKIGGRMRVMARAADD